MRVDAVTWTMAKPEHEAREASVEEQRSLAERAIDAYEELFDKLSRE